MDDAHLLGTTLTIHYSQRISEEHQMNQTLLLLDYKSWLRTNVPNCHASEPWPMIPLFHDSHVRLARFRCAAQVDPIAVRTGVSVTAYSLCPKGMSCRSSSIRMKLTGVDSR